jgi:hypothetical protein
MCTSSSRIPLRAARFWNPAQAIPLIQMKKYKFMFACTSPKQIEKLNENRKLIVGVIPISKSDC